MQPQHLIQKYIFDVDFDSEDKAYQFQNQLAAYIKEKVVGATDEVFLEMFPNHTIGINKLIIDLGEIKLDNIESQLAQLIKSKLSEKLQMLVSGEVSSTAEEEMVLISNVESDLKVLEYFFNHGTLPWSARKNDPEFSIKKILTKYIYEDPSEVKRIVTALIYKEEVKLRIIRQLEDVVLWEIVKLWAETRTPKIQQFYSDVERVYIKRPILKNYFSEYRELAWKFLLSEVIVLQKHRNEIPVIAADFLAFASKEIQRPFNEVLQEFHNVILEEKNSVNSFSAYQTSLPEIIKKLTIQAAKEDGQKPPFSTKVNEQEKNKPGQKEFEAYKQQQIKAKQEFLISLLKVMILISDKTVIETEIKKAEIYIEDFIISNPVFLKKSFELVNLDIQELRGQEIVEFFSPKIRAILLKELFKIDNKEYERLKLEASEKAVMAFLQTGFLPYSILPLSFEEREFENIVKVVLEALPEKKGKELVKKWILTSPDILFKKMQIERYLSSKTINNYFPFEFLDPVISKAKTQKPKNEKGKKEKGKIEKGKTEINYLKLSSLKYSDSLVFVLRDFLQEKTLPVKSDYTISQLVEKFYAEHKTEAESFFKILKPDEFKLIEKEVTPSMSKIIIGHREGLIKSVKEIQQAALKPVVEVQESTGIEEKKPFRKLESGEPVYISNAGLVIFHPYLARFFKMFDLLNKKEFKDEFSAHKAAHLLQYLVNKGLNCEEHEMVLNKLLCGIDLQVALRRDIEITEEEKNICEGLIEGVIQNWTILKKTSNDNFRASFVIREGRLVQESRDWRLKVEERGYDILVEKLPWSVSMIKLPWMGHMIFVEWK